MNAHKLPVAAACSALSLFLAGLTTTLGSESIGVLPDSAESIATAGGRLANLDDPSTLSDNPANMIGFASPEFQVNLGFWRGDLSFQNALGQSVNLLDDWIYVGSAYYVHPLGDRATVGLGISAPFGLNFDFPEQSAIRYVSPHEGLLLTADISPALAIQLNDSLSIGLGLDVMYSLLNLKQHFPWAALTGAATPDGEFEWDADGWGVGGHGGLTWEIFPGQRIALTGRLPIEVDFDGDFTASRFPDGLEAQGFSPNSDFRSDIKFPGSLGVGYGIDLSEKLTFGADFQYFFNSSHDDVPLLIGANQPLLGTDGVILNWEDSYDAGFGLEYALNEVWTLRGGYMFSSNSYPDFTYLPAVPANERHLGSLGLGYEKGRHRIDFTYSYAHFPDRTIPVNQQPAYIGDYLFDWHVFSVSYGIKF